MTGSWSAAVSLADRLPGARYVPPQGGYLAWIDCRDLDLDGEAAEVFRARGRVALAPGPTFGPPGAGHVRVTMATGPEILAEIVERMRASVG